MVCDDIDDSLDERHLGLELRAGLGDIVKGRVDAEGDIGKRSCRWYKS